VAYGDDGKRRKLISEAKRRAKEAGQALAGTIGEAGRRAKRAATPDRRPTRDLREKDAIERAEKEAEREAREEARQELIEARREAAKERALRRERRRLGLGGGSVEDVDMAGSAGGSSASNPQWSKPENTAPEPLPAVTPVFGGLGAAGFALDAEEDDDPLGLGLTFDGEAFDDLAQPDPWAQVDPEALPPDPFEGMDWEEWDQRQGGLF
jgi:hypothetical protein